MIIKVKNLYNQIMGDSLSRNSIYLMLSTAVMAGLGFIFWIINTHLFTTEQVGLGTTMISILTLISSFSLLGLNNGIIRYLAKSERKTEKINTSFTLVSALALIISVLFITGLHTFSPKLLFIRNNFIYTALFVLFSIFSALNLLIESVFIAYRSTIFVFIKSLIFSISKLILPFLFVSFGAFGIFASSSTAMLFAFIGAFIFLGIKFNYQFSPALHTGVISRMLKFTAGNYIAGFFGSLPLLLLPIIITNRLGPQQSAYFYIDLMIANLLYIIPMAASQSLFAEGSFNEEGLKSHLKIAVKIILLFLTPSVVFVILFGKIFLLLFGQKYSIEGFQLLQLFAISALFISINNIGNSLLNLQHRISLLIILNCFLAIITISLIYLFIAKGLLGIGLALLIPQGIISSYYLLFSPMKYKIVVY